VIESFYRRAGKRMVDMAVVVPAAVVLSPVAIVVALLVRVGLGSPVLFRQPRPGVGGRLFMLRKFRTMTNDRGADGELLDDAARLNGIGRWIRSASLDELPQLWNVLTGEMSLVGPRPLLAEYLSLYTPEQSRRHDVRPGITGWAQVNGRNCLEWNERFAHDVWYVENISFRLDMKIMWVTLSHVLRRKDTAAVAHASMPRFTGSPK
jgi:sugar transferase EpsL